MANTWSTTNWTKFYHSLTTYPPRLNNFDHFTHNLPFVSMTKCGLSTDHRLPLLVHVIIECPHTTQVGNFVHFTVFKKIK